jgi:hypothetical protein
MATVTTLRTTNALRRISAALRDFAKHEGWQPDEYQILFRVLENWGRISALLVVKDFGGLTEKEMWGRVVDHLDQSLKPGGDIGFSIGLSVRERKQVEQGGMYAIPEGYVEEELLLNPAGRD